ncbi:dUTP diphosphatase [Evansella sp. LMS18]|uniref:dUTP diphosphatase n=1 Tax=Evansella sp. LMS18 TaxID=2924033 RepID=UPI0020D0A1BD|nr:dUTP diphosphatase [Evansella sp. LMS18]UTR11332.1 dUTP diphosphatase [Evansella sp. LMS18]
MDFSELFTMQKKLDNYIETKHGLKNEQLLERKLLAFHVELAELANETRCFKFWSEKGPSPEEVILEEYVDGIHFILSVGLEQGFQGENDYDFPVIERKEGPELVPYFYQVIDAVSRHQKEATRLSFRGLFGAYLQTGAALGFTEEQILAAYYNKNEVNHERQNQGY